MNQNYHRLAIFSSFSFANLYTYVFIKRRFFYVSLFQYLTLVHTPCILFNCFNTNVYNENEAQFCLNYSMCGPVESAQSLYVTVDTGKIIES